VDIWEGSERPRGSGPGRSASRGQCRRAVASPGLARAVALAKIAAGLFRLSWAVPGGSSGGLNWVLLGVGIVL